jgi:hypothetical protein
MRKIFFFTLIVCFLSALSSCTKHVDPNAEGGICDRLDKVRIVTNKTTYYIGDTIDLAVTDVVNGFYTWRHSVIPNDLSTDTGVHIDYATKDYEGWFYLNINSVECNESVNDSIYIEVVNKPADAPCDPTNNTANFSSIPNISFSSTTYDIDPSYNRKYIRGYQSFGYPDIVVYFHPFWLDKEPEDGEYDMGSGGIGFGSSNVYEVFITSTYSGIFFEPTGGEAYVSHVNGKLQVKFCDVPLSGSFGGNSFTTTVSGKLTAS